MGDRTCVGGLSLSLEIDEGGVESKSSNSMLVPKYGGCTVWGTGSRDGG